MSVDGVEGAYDGAGEPFFDEALRSSYCHGNSVRRAAGGPSSFDCRHRRNHDDGTAAGSHNEIEMADSADWADLTDQNRKAEVFSSAVSAVSAKSAQSVRSAISNH